MLIIGHRGAAGLAPENSIEAIEAGIQAGADIIEIDVRITRDKQLVLMHDARLQRTHGHRDKVSSLTYEELCQLVGEKSVPLLSKVLDQFYGKILINIEIKSRGTAIELFNLLEKKYVKKASDWDNVLISSFMGYELVRLRRLSKDINLAMLHNENPFIFIAYHRAVGFTAVGFHRLYLNNFAIEIAKKAGIFMYTYTVDRPGAVSHISRLGIEGVVTNYPDKIAAWLAKTSE